MNFLRDQRSSFESCDQKERLILHSTGEPDVQTRASRLKDAVRENIVIERITVVALVLLCVNVESQLFDIRMNDIKSYDTLFAFQDGHVCFIWSGRDTHESFTFRV